LGLHNISKNANNRLNICSLASENVSENPASLPAYSWKSGTSGEKILHFWNFPYMPLAGQERTPASRHTA
jgi:hypothetical protein